MLMLTLHWMPRVAFGGRFADPPVHVTLNSFCPYITEHFVRGVRNPDPLVVLEEEADQRIQGQGHRWCLLQCGLFCASICLSDYGRERDLDSVVGSHLQTHHWQSGREARREVHIQPRDRATVAIAGSHPLSLLLFTRHTTMLAEPMLHQVL